MLATKIDYKDEEEGAANEKADQKVDISRYVQHPTKRDTFIGMIKRIGTRRFRGLVFMSPITQKALLKGTAPKIAERPIIRETHRACAWAIGHKFSSDHGLLGNTRGMEGNA